MASVELIERELTGAVIAAFFAVYNRLGFGFLEEVYAAALVRELRKRGHHVAREVSVSVLYDGVIIAKQRIDLLVDGRLVVEIKATNALHPSARRQLFNYLRATRLRVGLLLHFGPEPKFYREVCTRG